MVIPRSQDGDALSESIEVFRSCEEVVCLGNVGAILGRSKLIDVNVVPQEEKQVRLVSQDLIPNRLWSVSPRARTKRDGADAWRFGKESVIGNRDGE